MRLTSKNVIVAVEKEFGVSTALLKGDRVRNKMKWARYTAIALCRECLGLSFPQLGRVFGNKQSSMQYAIRQCDAELARNPELRGKYQGLKDRINTRRAA